jgi:hypothetical protein
LTIPRKYIVYQHRRCPLRQRHFKEENMFEITEKADGMIKDFIKDKGDIPGIRLFLAQGG